MKSLKTTKQSSSEWSQKIFHFITDFNNKFLHCKNAFLVLLLQIYAAKIKGFEDVQPKIDLNALILAIAEKLQHSGRAFKIVTISFEQLSPSFFYTF